MKTTNRFGILLLFAALSFTGYSCKNGKDLVNSSFKPAGFNVAHVQKESPVVNGKKNDGSGIYLTPFPLDSFGMGCGCIWWLPQDSAANVFIAQNDINGENPDIAIDNKKIKMYLKFIRLIEKEHGVEHIGDSVIQTWENESLIINFYCVKTFTCADDSSSTGSEFCEVTKFKGKLRITKKSDKKERTYSILGDCGC